MMQLGPNADAELAHMLGGLIDGQERIRGGRGGIVSVCAAGAQRRGGALNR